MRRGGRERSSVRPPGIFVNEEVRRRQSLQWRASIDGNDRDALLLDLLLHHADQTRGRQDRPAQVRAALDEQHCDRLAVGAEERLLQMAVDMRELPHLPAAQVGDIELRLVLLLRVGKERELRSVRAESEIAFVRGLSRRDVNGR